jgi:acyl-coenzyme A thioesterase PaaI-like protein
VGDGIATEGNARMRPEVLASTDRSLRDKVHPRCVVCSPANQRGLGLLFTLAADRSVEACFDCDETFEGFPGIVNGGTVSSLLDGAMANCLFHHGHVAVTGELNIRFVRPVITNHCARVRAWIARPSPPYHVLKAQVIQGHQVKAWAIGKFVNQPQLAGESSDAS